MNRRTLLPSLLAVLLLAGCKPNAGSNQPSPSGNEPLSLQKLHMMSSAGLGDAGLSPQSIGTLASLYKLRDIERCVVKFKHWVYIDSGTDWRADKTFEREGYMLLLGCRDNKVIGLTTRCSVDFRKDLQYDDANLDDKKPGFVAGVLALENPTMPTNRDFYLVKHETDRTHIRFRKPTEYSRFNDEFFGKMRITADFWSRLMEDGDRVVVETLGNNDLAFVTFDKEKLLGTMYVPIATGLEVKEVMQDTVAFRAGLKSGDVLTAFDGRALRTGEDLGAALDAAQFGKAIPIQVVRDGAALTRHMVFNTVGNFMTQGKVGNLGLQHPEKVLSALLGELEKLGGLLRRELLVECHWCHERGARAPGEAHREFTDWMRDLVPILAGLVAGPEAAVGAKCAIAVIEGYHIASDICSQVGDLKAFLKNQFSLGMPIRLSPSSVRVLAGDFFEANDKAGKGYKIQLAHVKEGDDESKNYLSSIIGLSAASGCTLLAIPDGQDHKGNLHCHVVLLKPSQPAEAAADAVFPSTFSGFADLIANPSTLAAYLNLVMVYSGKAMAYDHSVGDGYSTRFLLKALRLVDRNKGIIPVTTHETPKAKVPETKDASRPLTPEEELQRLRRELEKLK